MNREILFRSWNERHKKFFYFKNGGYYSDEECEFSVYWSFFSWINAEQFTGKTVCDKKKLFEGHLIKYFSSVEFNEWDICAVEWDKDNCKFVLHYIDREECEDLDNTLLYGRMEIIGNVYDEKGGEE